MSEQNELAAFDESLRSACDKVRADPAFPDSFTWKRARAVWSFLWLGASLGARERGAQPLRALPRVCLCFVRMMWMWRGGVPLDDVIQGERERMEAG